MSMATPTKSRKTAATKPETKNSTANQKAIISKSAGNHSNKELSGKLPEYLQEYFGFSQFKDEQETIIQNL